MFDESFTSRPLANRTVVLACSAKKMAALAAGIEAMGGQALHFPVIEARDIEDKRPLDAALASLKEYSWIIFTSAYAIKFFVGRLKQLGVSTAAENMPRICAIGPATAKEIRDSGYHVELIPEKFVAESVVEALRKYHGSLETLAGRRILILKAKVSREVLPEALSNAGILVDAIPCYQTVRAEPLREIIELIRSKNPDMLVFTSSSAIKNYVEILGKVAGARTLMESAVAVLGPITGSTAETYGKSPDVLPRENTIESLLEAIREYFNSRRGID